MAGEPNDCSQSETQVFDVETVILKPEEALKCLRDEAIATIPMENIKACNNLDEYFVKSTLNSQKKHKASHGKEARSSRPFRSSFSSEPFAVPLERNIDKILKKTDSTDCEPESTSSSRKINSDVFSKADQIEAKSGPIVVLKERMGKTVKVLIRRRRKVPFISRVLEYKGTLVLFDKHMNLYLKNVIESFSYTIGEKLLKRARHRDSLMIRGDNIIVVS